MDFICIFVQCMSFIDHFCVFISFLGCCLFNVISRILGYRFLGLRLHRVLLSKYSFIFIFIYFMIFCFYYWDWYFFILFYNILRNLYTMDLWVLFWYGMLMVLYCIHLFLWFSNNNVNYRIMLFYFQWNGWIINDYEHDMNVVLLILMIAISYCYIDHYYYYCNYCFNLLDYHRIYQEDGWFFCKNCQVYLYLLFMK